MQFTATKEDGSQIAYKDGKRWLWFTGHLFVLVPVFTFWLYFVLEKNPLVVLIPFLYVFAFIPFLDWIAGEDPHNPPEEVVPAMSADRFYDQVAYSLIPLHYAMFIATVWFVGTQDLPIWAIIMLLLGVGTLNGNAINLGHELGHKTDKLNRFMAKMALGVVGYGHFTVEHNRGHHVHVSTPEDCASGRMGESVYAFALRELPGAFKGGWAHEAKRLRNKGLPLFHWQNEILQVYAMTTVIAVALVMCVGWAVLPFIIAHHFISWYGLTQVNYIEHYGLLRQKRKNGKYEPCQPHHSWNTNHIVSNLTQIHLQRHSDHHANPMRPYQALRNFPDLPRLPSGYPGCLALAAIPPLWFKVMDPKVMDWAKGDITRVNVCPKAKDQLFNRYGQTENQVSA
ncbi:alkane 1-monooxygenase [Parvularcula sp. IMCC14364]|uniref:alkane 1-monooxygenase n=1 Tax=Parvularcula sp. IMCC14364 TaxID=3067902 RepID=UPI0027424E45|nr:alkane 1-monooxygenase [Parvularcula sp. IMCC14364]